MQKLIKELTKTAAQEGIGSTGDEVLPKRKPPSKWTNTKKGKLFCLIFKGIF